MDDKLSSQDLYLSELKLIHKLISEISHEIRNPLGTSITAITHLKKEVLETQEKYNSSSISKKQLEEFLDNTTETTDIIYSNLNRAIDLVQSFKRVTGHQALDEKKTVNMYQILQDIKRTTSPRLKKINIDISIDGDRDLEIATYPGVIVQIMTNLIINSLTHAFEKKGTGKIDISYTADNQMVHLVYKDNGKGIPSEIQTHIFNEFYTTGNDKGGTGLGMHIIYTLVTERLSGNISLDSKPDQGVSFTISFPKK